MTTTFRFQILGWFFCHCCCWCFSLLLLLWCSVCRYLQGFLMPKHQEKCLTISDGFLLNDNELNEQNILFSRCFSEHGKRFSGDEGQWRDEQMFLSLMFELTYAESFQKRFCFVWVSWKVSWFSFHFLWSISVTVFLNSQETRKKSMKYPSRNWLL